MSNKHVGIIGVGLMGHGIATNIQKNGWPLSFLQHSGNQPTDNLTNKGATACQSLPEIARSCDIIILCVTGSPEVENILTSSDGLLQHIKKDTVIIDCSTAIPTSTIAMAALVEKAGGKFLDAPMTRTPKEAAEGRLNLIVGGEQSLFNEHLPLLEAFAENIEHTGAIGSGHTMKLLHNYVSLGFTTVLAEAAAAAKKSGVDPEVLHTVLAKGGGAGVVLDRMAPFILDSDTSHLAFTITNGAKDLSYYLQMCDDLRATNRVASAITDTINDQVTNGNGDAFMPELIDLLQEPAQQKSV